MLNEAARHEDVRKSGGKASCILGLDSKWWWVVGFTLRPASPADNHKIYTRWAVQPVWTFWKAGIKFWFIGRAVHSRWFCRLSYYTYSSSNNTKYNASSVCELQVAEVSKWNRQSWIKALCMTTTHTALCKEIPSNGSQFSVSTKEA